MLKVQSEVTRKTMTRRLSALLLAMTMVFQLVAPQASFAKEGTKKTNRAGAKVAQQDKKKYRKIGVINGTSYDGKIMNALNREAAKNRKTQKATPGFRLFSRGPYFGKGNEPSDADKPKYYGNIKVDFKLSGLDGNPFQWKEIFGVDEQGNPKPAQIIFVQTDDATGDETGVQYILKVTQTGQYTWSDENGKPTNLPLFSETLKPYKYEAHVDEDVAENIKLLTARMTGTEGSTTFKPENSEGKIIANITLDLGLQQVASTKFKSEWKTGVAEDQRPQIQGSIAEKVADLYDHPVVFDLPKNNKDVKIIRDWTDSFDEGLVVADALYKTPKVAIKTDTTGLTFEENNGVKTVTSGEHKYKYDFKYDVINGGKLTMTEVIPVTFDANGGKFASITDPDTKQEIKKEVEYDGTLIDKAENPTKDRETFKGWSETKGGTTPVKADAFKNITKAKTFYAIWDNNDIVANELEVKESFKDGTGYVNDFIPTLDQLKKQVKIKDADDNPQALENGDTFAIVNGTNEYTTDEAAKDYLYGLLKEKDDGNKPSRVESIKAKVTVNGRSKIVDIPIKVIKNIYEAKTETKPPYYVPDGYVKVTLDPTTKAQDSQKTYYYVNPDAKVVIPGKDPVGTGDNKFIKWTMKADDAAAGVKGEDYKLTDRHKFEKASTITAQYSADVVPQEGPNKPDGVPENFVKVTFNPTTNGTLEGTSIFWVNPAVSVTIPVNKPVGKTYYTFKEWKMGADATGDKYDPATATKFTEQETTITATYDESDTIIPYNPGDPDPMVRPKGYVKVTFAADTGLKLTEQKAYYVKKNANITLKAIKDDTTHYGYPAYEEVIGYKFDKWDKGDATEIKDADIVVTANATILNSVIPEKDKTGTENEKPTGYVEVNFKIFGTYGKISDGETTKYYVKPNTEVRLPLPKTEPGIGYEFDRWYTQGGKDFSSAPTKFTHNTDVWGDFKPLDSFIPKINNDGTENKMPKGYVTVTFDKGRDGEKITGQTVYYVNPHKGVLIKNLTKPEVTPKVGYRFKEWSHADSTEIKDNLNVVAGYTELEDVIPKIKEGGSENEQPTGYVVVKVVPTDKATEAADKIYFVNPNKEVTIPFAKPTGKDVPVDKNNPKAYKWIFSKWTSDEVPFRTWKDAIQAKFTNDTTTITANYEKEITDQGTVVAKEITVHESFKDGETWVNNFIDSEATEAKLKGAIKVKDASGADKALPNDATVTFVDDSGNAYADEAALKNALYDKLKEKDNPDGKPTRVEKVKAQVIFKNGEVQTVDIPMKVYKNIYESKTLGLKPVYVPNDYVKVTLDPTKKATDSQKTYYYVNPKAKVLIPGENPTGTGDNKFVKWAIGDTEYKLSERHQFSGETTITAQYVSDVIPAKSDGNKAEGTPDNFVKVTFVPTDKATDKTEKIFYVNPEKAVTIPVTDPKGATYYTFKEWKVGANAEGEVYKPNEAQKFEQATTITATYTEAENIIPYDPKEPTTRPEGYVRVTFAAEEGLTLSNVQAYYVKKDANITLGNAKLVKPEKTAKTGYMFTGWDKDDTTPIGANDIVVTAKATPFDDYDTKEHPGYVKVTFKADTNGVIKNSGGNIIAEQVYYVNPNKFVKLPAPTPVGNTGYDFAAWRSDQVTGDFSLANYVKYTKATTITATFNQKDAVYPKLDGTKKPAGYVEVTFKVTGTEGKIADKEITTYYVDPGREVSLKAPKTIAGTGFVFDGWRLVDNTTADKIDPAKNKQYKNDTTIYGSFKKLDDIIPATNEDGTTNLQPDDYVAVLFIKGDHAQKFKGQALYYVNPKASPNKTIGDLTQPTITPDTGWKFTGWDKANTTEIKDYMFVIAKYEKIDDVIPALKDDGNPNEKPAGYVTVTFNAGDNGHLEGITEKVYYVNPNSYVKLNAPNTKPDNGYAFGSWKSDGNVFSLDNFIKYEKNTTITANFNLKGNVIPKTQPNDTEKPKGFVTVNFVIEGQGGQIEANQVVTYFVKKDAAVTIHPPKTKAEVGYEFEKWDKDTTTPTAYTDEVTTVKGSFKKLDAIIKSKESNGTVNAKPEGYVTVQFLKGDHGVLDGQTTFYVNPKAGKTLEDLKPGDITIVPEKTYKFANWDKELTTTITGDTSVTAKYTQLPNIIKAGPKDKAPVGYVVVIFETDGRGTITGNAEYEDKTNPAKNETEIVYFVNPDKNVKLAAADATASETVLPVPSTTPDDATKYEFDQWRTAIDTTTPITRGRVHIAMFKPKQVTLTYDANGATEGTAPAEVKVDYNTSVGLANQGDLKKANASFAGWKIGDTVYKAGDQITLTKDATAIAQWTEDKTIIPYDPKEPTSRPDNTYVKVTFEAETGLKLTEQKAYYVKKNAKDANGDALTLKAIKDDATNYGYPAYTEDTGYKFDKWDPADTTTIADKDIVVKAKATYMGNVIPEKDGEGNPNTKPKGYKEVTFVIKTGDESKGSIDGVAKFYVKPNEFVTINPPTTKANTGFVFGTWDKDATIPTVYKDDTIITGSFNGLKDVIPNKNPNGTENKQPAGYKTVTFVIDPATGGKIQDGQVTVYYVNPAKEVTVPQPNTEANTGYSFAGWNADTSQATKYERDTTIKGSFTKGNDIIPQGKTDGSDKPVGYVTVTFDKGANGSLDGKTVYYVNPNANKTLADVTHPTIKPNTGFTANGWDKEDTTPITGTADITVTAQYLPKDDVIPKTKEDGSDNDKPVGYVTVTFDKGEHGKELTGPTVYYVNPNKAVVLQGKAPTAVPNTGYKFARWDTSIDKPTLYKEGDTITALYNNPDVISTKEIAGYVKVEFKPGAHGSLSGPTDYWVKPGVDVYLPSPLVNANDGYQFDGWDQSLSVKFNAGAPTYVIKAKYTEKQYPTPQPDPIPQPYPTPQPYPAPYPVPGETKTVYKDRTVLRREVRYMQGFEGKFRPDDGLTRAEAAQILANALKEDGYPFDLRYKLPYKDTTKEMWYNDAVRITTQADVFIGYDDGEFKPQRKITRAEWIATLRRFQYVDKVGGNSLHMRKNHWAIPEVEAAYRSGWLSIYTEKKAPFNYDEPISRKEVAAVSNRAFRRVRDMDYIRRNDKFMINYTDINRDMWAYDDILCASNTFLHQRQGAYIAYKRGDKAYTIDVKDAIIEQDLFQRIPRHR